MTVIVGWPMETSNLPHYPDHPDDPGERGEAYCRKPSDIGYKVVVGIMLTIVVLFVLAVLLFLLLVSSVTPNVLPM
jgi:hypothetical protein